MLYQSEPIFSEIVEKFEKFSLNFTKFAEIREIKKSFF